jgi:hypothetical protein
LNGGAVFLSLERGSGPLCERRETLRKGIREIVYNIVVVKAFEVPCEVLPSGVFAGGCVRFTSNIPWYLRLCLFEWRAL